MKKFFAKVVACAATLVTAAFISLQFGQPAKAADFKLSWTDTNAPAYAVTNYNVYISTNNAPFVLLGTTNTPSFVATNLSPNLYGFYFTCLNVWGESAPSSVVQLPPGLPGAPGVQVYVRLK